MKIDKFNLGFLIVVNSLVLLFWKPNLDSPKELLFYTMLFFFGLSLVTIAFCVENHKTK